MGRGGGRGGGVGKGKGRGKAGVGRGGVWCVGRGSQSVGAKRTLLSDWLPLSIMIRP